VEDLREHATSALPNEEPPRPRPMGTKKNLRLVGSFSHMTKF
jgi:hypothetical protein